jgi:hypothetical protein
MSYQDQPAHPLGECLIAFMTLISFRLRVFAVNELRF